MFLGCGNSNQKQDLEKSSLVETSSFSFLIEKGLLSVSAASSPPDLLLLLILPSCIMLSSEIFLITRILRTRTYSAGRVEFDPAGRKWPLFPLTG